MKKRRFNFRCLMAGASILMAAALFAPQQAKAFTKNKEAVNIQQTINGHVTDTSGKVLAGVSVLIKGTKKGTLTDANGDFSLEAKSSDVLVISYIGFKNKDVPINGQSNLHITLEPLASSLNEVIVVGYGTQQKKLVTGAIATVNAKDIAGIPHDGRVEVALQGRTPGVTIAATSGQPGSEFTVRLRGLSSFLSGNEPLWVVDGIIVQQANLGFLNQSDIESIDVLKDAASASIYGTRSGNGVILVTTKHGREGKMVVNYNGYYGSQAPARLMPMANATQYATLMNEQASADGATSLPYPAPSILGEGTNWQKQIFVNNALRTNHELSISGGNQYANLYISAGYQDQEGIVLPQVSGFKKYSLRINHNEQFLKIFKFGQSIGYTRNNSKGVGTNTEFGEALSDALQLDPLTPPYISKSDATGIQYQASPNNIVAPNGMLYGISNLVTQEVVNPLGYAQIRLGNTGWSDNIIGNTYLEINPMKGLKFRSQISVNRNYWGDRTYTPQYYQTGIRHQDFNSLSRHSGVGTEWNWDNTISYNTSVKEHNFDIVVGQAISEDGIGNETWFTEKNLPVDNYKDANFNWTTANGAADITASTDDYVLHRIASVFGRLNYDYAQKYLLTAIVRSDGSTHFGANKKWGTFPSVSVGWVPSLENFWKNNMGNAVNFLKIRSSYGITGNDEFGNFYYISTIQGGVNYVFGTAGSPVAGASPSTLSNPDLGWEQTAQTDIGLDARFLNDFSFTFDYFNKITNDALEPVTLPLYAGVPNQPWANQGRITNTGIELQLGYNKQLSDWTIGATANFATVKNKINDIGSGNSYAQFSEATYQNLNNNVGTLTREVDGYPVHGFWGYKTNGIFQTQADVQNYKSTNGKIIQPNAEPGDFRWKDINGDGVIDANDVTYLGSGLPTYTYGLTINLGYGNKQLGNFDLLIFINGQGGNKIFQDYRRFDAGAVNFPQYYLNRWTGPGTSNTFPRLATFGLGDASNGNFTNMSDFYLHNGDFLRFKNIQLGYTLPERIAKSIRAEKLRIYVAAENLLTLTKYNGLDPEIGGNVFGVDKGFYPQSRTLMVGVNLQF